MNKTLWIGAVAGALTAGTTAVFSMSSCTGSEVDSTNADPNLALTEGDTTVGTSEEALASCGVANTECCPGNCCSDGSECVYRAFQPNVCRKPPAGGSHILSCNSCNPIHLAGCGGALAACAAACAVTGPGCAACFAGIGAPACFVCVHH